MGDDVLRSEDEKAARDKVADGLRYAREHGWPDKPMMTRREIADRIILLSQATDRSGLPSGFDSMQAAALGWVLTGEEICADDADRLALAEKCEREEQG